MKTLITTLLILISLQTYCQECNSLDKIISIQGGYPANISVEGGVQSEFIGGFIGLKGTPSMKRATEIYPASQNFNLNPYIKGSFKLAGSGEDQIYRVWLIGYWGKSVYGAGIKTGVIVYNDLMIFVEPMFTEQKMEGNLGLSFRF